jgi:hypothetical protein
MDMIKATDRVHLLGCQVPQEFIYIKICLLLKLLIHQNPIMATLVVFNWSNGLTEKPKADLNHNFIQQI